MTPSARSLVKGVRDALAGLSYERGQTSLSFMEVTEFCNRLTKALSQPRFTEEEREAIDAAIQAFKAEPKFCTGEDGDIYQRAAHVVAKKRAKVLTSMLDTREGKEPLP